MCRCIIDRTKMFFNYCDRMRLLQASSDSNYPAFDKPLESTKLLPLLKNCIHHHFGTNKVWGLTNGFVQEPQERRPLPMLFYLFVGGKRQYTPSQSLKRAILQLRGLCVQILHKQSHDLDKCLHTSTLCTNSYINIGKWMAFTTLSHSQIPREWLLQTTKSKLNVRYPSSRRKHLIEKKQIKIHTY